MFLARHQWLTPAILATQEQKSGGSQFKSSLGKYFKRPYLEKKKKTSHLGVAQGVGPEFKP
jgi:hypothetical protein